MQPKEWVTSPAIWTTSETFNVSLTMEETKALEKATSTQRTGGKRNFKKNKSVFKTGGSFQVHTPAEVLHGHRSEVPLPESTSIESFTIRHCVSGTNCFKSPSHKSSKPKDAASK